MIDDCKLGKVFFRGNYFLSTIRKVIHFEIPNLSKTRLWVFNKHIKLSKKKILGNFMILFNP
jgi:hypothetical protein